MPVSRQVLDRCAPVLVAACGNSLAGDDAFGLLVAERLQTLEVPELQVVVLGMKPAGLLSHLDDRIGLVVVDAAERDCGYSVGQLIDLDFMSHERPGLIHDATLSSHGLSIAHELELAAKLGMLPPRVHLIATPVLTTRIGDPPTDCIVNLVRPAVQRIIDLAKLWRRGGLAAR